MANIVVLGAGVMGSTLASVAATKNTVTLVGSPLDNAIIESIKKGNPHPDLGVGLDDTIVALASNELSEATMKNADVLVLGVSSPGVDWALGVIQHHQASPNILALVTKGLVGSADTESAPRTYAQTIDAQLTTPNGRIVGIGGPCIARELALAYPTRVCFASEDKSCADELRELLKTDYYFIATHTDFCGLEACAALKNFLCIGVSAMLTSYQLDQGHAKNPLAALFNQAVHEIALLSQWIKRGTGETNDNPAGTTNTASATSTTSTTGTTNATGTTIATNATNATNATSIAQDLAFDLAGLGDLHVTVGGGRNSKLGQFLGSGRLLSDILRTDMRNVTVEGVDTGKQLLPGFRHACRTGGLKAEQFPLTVAVLDVIEHERPFKFEFRNLPG